MKGTGGNKNTSRHLYAIKRLFLPPLLLFTAQTQAQSLSFFANDQPNPIYEYGQQLDIPAGFGEGEFTFECWIRPDDSFPIGPTTPGTPAQRINWSDADNEPYSSGSWWFEGNFLLDGHNNASFTDGTFSLQFYGGGRVRWLFGDGSIAGEGGVRSIGAFPASGAPSLLDGDWHQLTLVRRWVGADQAQLELWIDGVLADDQLSPLRTDMRQWWSSWPGFPGGQEGWFWGVEKQAAIGVLSQYEDYKGLLDEVRFWSRAKTPMEIANEFADPVNGSEPGLVGYYPFSEGQGVVTVNNLTGGQAMDLFNGGNLIWSDEDVFSALFTDGFELGAR